MLPLKKQDPFQRPASPKKQNERTKSQEALEKHENFLLLHGFPRLVLDFHFHAP
jgi:hypothetical protein